MAATAPAAARPENPARATASSRYVRGRRAFVGSLPVLLVLLASLAVSRPLWTDSFPFGTDSLLHLYRALDFYQVLQAGVWWPRIAPSLFFGFGYPVFEFYSPGVYFLAAGFQAVGLSVAGALKGVLWLALVLPGLGAYLYARAFLSPWASAAVAALYATAPYHLMDTFFRGGYTEPLACTFFPLVLWTLHRPAARPGTGSAWLIALALAGLVLTHNLSAYLFAPFAALGFGFSAWQARRRSGRPGLTAYVRTVALGGLIVVGLTAIHWLPIVAESGAVQVGRLTRFVYADFFTPVLSLLDFHPVAQIGGAGVEDTGAGNLHLVQTLGLIFGLATLVMLRRRLGVTAPAGLLWTVMVALGLFLVTDASALLWEAVPLLELAQFPWRFMGPVSLPVALLAGVGVEGVRATWRPALAGGLTVTTVLTAGSLGVYGAGLAASDLTPAAIPHFELAVGADGGATGEWLPRELAEVPRVSAWALEQVTGVRWPESGERPLQRVAETPVARTYHLTDWAGGPRTLDTAGFPGWEARSGSRVLPVSREPGTGLIRVDLPAGDHDISLHFTGTPVQKVAGAVSAMTAIVLAGWLRRRFWTRWRRAGPPTGLLRAVAIAGLGVVLPTMLVSLRVSLPAATADRAASVHFEGIEVTGYQLAQDVVSPGDSLPVTVTWRGISRDPNATIFARLTNRTSLAWTTAEAAINDEPAGAGRVTLSLDVPPGTPPGSYQMQIGVTEGGRIVPATALARIGRYQPIADLRVGPVSVVPEASSAAGAPGLTGEIDLVRSHLLARPGHWWNGEQSGWPVTPDRGPVSVQAGWVLQGRYLWRNGDAPLGDREIVVRLLDDSARAWAEHRGRPVDRLYPTTYWLPGEEVLDIQDLYLEPDLPPGRYTVQVAGEAAGDGPGGAGAAGTWTAGDVIVDVPDTWPEPDRYPADRVDRALLPGLTLLNARTATADAQAGGDLLIESRWHAPDGKLPDLLARWEIAGSGHVWSSAVGSLTGRPDFPSSERPAGTVVRGQQRIALDPFIPPGDYQLRLVLVDAATGRDLATTDLQPIKIAPGGPVTEVTPDVRSRATFGDAIALAGFDPWGKARALGADLPAELQMAADRQLALRLYWQTRQSLATDYTVFVQVLAPDGRLVAQHDAPPMFGARPTSSWRPGEIVADDHVLEGTASLGPGRYQVIAGLYDPRDGRRLVRPEGGDHVVLATLDISSGGSDSADTTAGSSAEPSVAR